MEFIKCLLQQVRGVICLLPPGGDGAAEQVQGEEQGGPGHTKPAGQEMCRKCEFIG